MVNVWGDAIATGCVAHMSRKEVADYENELKMKNQPLTDVSNNSEEHLVEHMVDNDVDLEANSHMFKF